jgi:hypothetical protein
MAGPETAKRRRTSDLDVSFKPENYFFILIIPVSNMR